MEIWNHWDSLEYGIPCAASRMAILFVNHVECGMRYGAR